MADSTLTALTAASALDPADLTYVVQGGLSRKATGTQLLALVGTTYVPLAGGTMTGNLVISGANLVVPKTSGYGIKVDASTPTFGWRDITSDITVRGTAGANTPSWNVFRNGLRLYQFTVNDECWHVFHVPHDYVPGSDIFIHAHWAHASASVTSGAATWGFEATFAKGFDQAAFPATVTTTVAQNASATQYQHMIAEVQLTAATPTENQIDSDLIEIDGLFLVRTYLSANSINGTPEPYLMTVDLHYQSTNMATKAKAPSFYT